VLLNLARASRFEPLYFMNMTRVTGSGTSDLKLGLPTVVLGPGAPVVRNYQFGGNNTNILDNNTVTSFDVSLLSSKDFYAGLMSPLSLEDVDLLLHQGFARELIFYLVIDKAKITPSVGEPFVVYNDPTDPKRFAMFEGYIREAMLHGLTTETYQAADDSAPDDSASGGKGAKPKPKMTSHAEVCFDRALATADARADFPATANMCVANPPTPASGGASNLTVNLHGEQMQIDVYTRSIFGMFNYLGGMIARGDSATVHLHAYPELPAEVTADEPLLTVVKGGAFDLQRDCFAGVGYEGDSYCVPRNGSDNTKKIFNILNALLALKTAPGDVTITPTVRIAP
jgi:hypothetical protein